MRESPSSPRFDALRAAAARGWPGSRIAWAALAAGVIWAVLVLAYGVGFFAAGGAALPRGMVFLDGVFFLIALFLPLLLIWLAARLATELGRQHAQVELLVQASAPLVGALEATRSALEIAGPVNAADIERAVQGAVRSAQPDLAGPIAQLRAAQKELRTMLTALGPRETAAPAAAPTPAQRPRRPRPTSEAAGQPHLPLIAETAAPERPDWDGLVRALDFPKDAEDREGFRALRFALRHHSLATTLQAAEDLLTQLAQEGIYVDDLAHEHGDPVDWRRFIEGRRGVEVASVGGIGDAHALEVTRGLMKSDPIFRDTALFFQRRFGVVLSEYGEGAGDAQLIELADTRSGRAFQLLARVCGAFD